MRARDFIVEYRDKMFQYVKGVITFGVGRFISACLRGDRTMSVWDLRG